MEWKSGTGVCVSGEQVLRFRIHGTVNWQPLRAGTEALEIMLGLLGWLSCGEYRLQTNPSVKEKAAHPLDGDRQSKAEVGVGERANRNSWCVSELTPKQTLRSFITPEVISVCGIIQIRTKGWRAELRAFAESS